VQIGIDARELCGQSTGVGRYLSRLLAAWTAMPESSAHRFILYAPSSAGAPPPTGALTGLNVETRAVAGGSGTWWEQVRLARAVRHDRPDVLFAPAYTAPLALRTPTVLTVHDLSFLAHPEWFPWRMRMRQRIVTAAAARRAWCVLTDSEFSGAEIVGRLGIPRSRIRVIPLGLASPAGPQPGSGSRPREAMVLFVGSIFNRRHVPDSIHAVAAVARRHPDVRLEIVGDNRTHPHQDLEAIARLAGIAERTTIRAYVADDVLADLYGRAGAFVFLSDYEGFGLTPLEALSSGVPVVVGDTPVAREVYGKAARYVGTADIGTAADELEALLFDANARHAVLAEAPAVLARYSWERAGRDTLSALLQAAGASR
jgi:glycosyltransferase involved in cell wall biosynthesis